MRATSETRAGFALPAVVLTITLLTVALVAAFSTIGGERRVNENQKAQLTALALSETGLEQFLVNRVAMGFSNVVPAPYESTRVTLPEGYADVVLQQVRPALDSTMKPLYVVRSHGVETRRSLRAWVPHAEHTVSQLAFWESTPIVVFAGWTSLTGLQENGGSGTLSGSDACAVKTAVAGVAVPSVPGYSQNGGSPVPTGNPPILSLGTVQQMASLVKINWSGIVNGTAVTPDVDLARDPWPSFADPSYWPVIIARGDLSLPGSGRGTLIVSGDLTISGSLRWDGVILVGNSLRSNGNNTVEGATISGLNVKLGGAPPVGSVGNGTKTYRYNSCDVDNAMQRFRGLKTLPNTWADNWSTY